jgi:hypothetical protein
MLVCWRGRRVLPSTLTIDLLIYTTPFEFPSISIERESCLAKLESSLYLHLREKKKEKHPIVKTTTNVPGGHDEDSNDNDKIIRGQIDTTKTTMTTIYDNDKISRG